MGICMESDRLAYRRLEPSDAAVIFARHAKALSIFMPNERCECLAEAERILRLLGGRADEGKMPFVLAIVRKEDGRLIGEVGLGEAPEGLEVGYWVEELCGEGYAAEAVRALSEYAARRFVLDALYGKAARGNAASVQALEEAGFAPLHGRVWTEDGSPGAKFEIYRREFPGYSRLISQRQWNLPDKGERESQRESTFIDDIVQKGHIERALLENLNGIETAFDGGAGCGRFSILLAKRGIHVVHFDISRPMLDKARELAEAAGASRNMEFVQGALEDLLGFESRGFDLVLSVDAPISYTYPRQEQVISELMRIAKKRVLLSVSSRLGSLPYWANPVQKNQFILRDDVDDPWARWCLENERAAIEGFRFDKAAAHQALSSGLMGGAVEIGEYLAGGAPWPITYGFLPEELKGLMEKYGATDVRLAGPGAYARTVPNKVLRKLMSDPAQKADFLDFCYQYDQNSYVLGMGKDNLVALGAMAES